MASRPLSSIGAGICLLIYGVLMLASSGLLVTSGVGASFLVIMLITGLFGVLAIVASIGLFNNTNWSRVLGFAVLALSIAFNMIFAATTMASSPSHLVGLAGILNGMATAFAVWLVLLSGAWAFR